MSVTSMHPKEVQASRPVFLSSTEMTAHERDGRMPKFHKGVTFEELKTYCSEDPEFAEGLKASGESVWIKNMPHWEDNPHIARFVSRRHRDVVLAPLLTSYVLDFFPVRDRPEYTARLAYIREDTVTLTESQASELRDSIQNALRILDEAQIQSTE